MIYLALCAIALLTVVTLNFEKKWKFQPEPLARLMDRLYLTPNLVTLLRTILVVIVIILMKMAGADWKELAAFWLTINFLNWLALYGDHLDGVIARYQAKIYEGLKLTRLGFAVGVSDTGKVWDPTADKFHTISLILIQWPTFDDWAKPGIALVVLLDLCLLVTAWTKFYLARNGSTWIEAVNTGASKGGKTKMIILAVGLSFCLLFNQASFWEKWFFRGGECLLNAAIIFAILSLVGHLKAFKFKKRTA